MQAAKATSEDTETRVPVVVLIAEFYALGARLAVLREEQAQLNDARDT